MTEYTRAAWILLIGALKKAGKVITVVPERERSGTSHSITLHKPFRVKEIRKDVFIANGTPADCVKYGVRYLAKNKVDLVVSGINSCSNLAQDITYSGTSGRGKRSGDTLMFQLLQFPFRKKARCLFIKQRPDFH